jgi:hypothetical protein
MKTILDETPPYNDNNKFTKDMMANFITRSMVVNTVLSTVYQQLVLLLIFYWGDPWWGRIEVAQELQDEHGLSNIAGVSTMWKYDEFYTSVKNGPIWS